MFPAVPRSAMNKRPLSITMISWLFIAVGVLALLFHFLPHLSANGKESLPPGHELIWISLVR